VLLPRDQDAVADRVRLEAAVGFESSTSFMCSGELTKPSEIRSSTEYVLSSRGSDEESA
jgi:hypothetical protein